MKAYITDSHLGQELKTENGISYVNNPTAHTKNFEMILDDIAERGIHEIVFGGDIGSVEMNKWFFDVIAQRGLSLWMVLGNHDTFAEVSQYYREPANYIKEDVQFRYIILDTSDNKIDADRLNWVKQMLNTEKEIILFVHHPVLAIDTPIEQLGAALKDRDELKAVLKSIDKKVTVFCGHYHMIDEAEEDNIYQYTTPAVSYQIGKETADVEIDQTVYGYRIINTIGGEITTELVLFLTQP
ncbi:metallophosphoesterase family protein [Chitinophaga sp.]|uniref:metallophosphoesterase family protein n=1 Tax=Chitinophaga sp. TaxID=1869181 RepID=UPI0031E07653